MSRRKAYPRVACRHCDSGIPHDAKCSLCQAEVAKERRCRACHGEVRHGVIPLGSVHLVGNHVPGMGLDDDYDQSARADD